MIWLSAIHSSEFFVAGEVMRTVWYGAKCGAVLSVVPGAVMATMVYLLSFPHGGMGLVTGPILWAAMTGVIMVIGAMLGALFGGLVEVFRRGDRKSHGAV